MKVATIFYLCSCGQRVPIDEDNIPPGGVTCPSCGNPIDLDSDPTEPIDWEDETQMVNIRDMAKMAQEGVEMSVSGEWDTNFSSDKDDTRSKRKKRDK